MKKLLLLGIMLFLSLTLVAGAPHADFPAFSAAESGFVVTQGPPPNSGEILALHISITDMAVYKYGYMYTAGSSQGWERIDLEGTTFQGSSDWFTGEATTYTDPVSEGTHYIIAYSCSRVANSWDCHDGKWQLYIEEIGGTNDCVGDPLEQTVTVDHGTCQQASASCVAGAWTGWETITCTCDDGWHYDDADGCAQNTQEPFCGDNNCDMAAGENCASCAGDCGPCPTTGGAIIADHNAADDFDIIPDCWIEEAKSKFDIAYEHTSHGSQIPSGLTYLESQNSLYDWSTGSSTPTVLYIDDTFSGGSDLGSSSFASTTRTYLSSHSDINVVMWSWCTICGHSISAYVDGMDSLIADYPNVQFIFMTGHLAASVDSSYNWGCSTREEYHGQNTQIRAHVNAIDGILFDFGDIEAYNEGASSFCNTNSLISDHSCPQYPVECDWSGPGPSSCSHSKGENCARKAKAFWWMMARMAGWDGTAGDNTC